MANKFKLPEEIIKKSNSNNWDEAKKEWKISNILYATNDKEYETCLCGHYPIKEIIYLKNFITEETVITGNCCVDKFYEGGSQKKVFDAIKRGKINRSMIDIVYEKGVIKDKEYKFACDVWRKRKLSVKQKKWFDFIKNKVIKEFE